MIICFYHKLTKPLLQRSFKELRLFNSIKFVPVKEGERQFKPPNQFTNRNWVRVWPLLPTNAKFNQVNADFNKGNALKACIYRVFHVLYQNIVSNFSPFSAAGSLLDPQVDSKRGAFVFVPPN